MKADSSLVYVYIVKRWFPDLEDDYEIDSVWYTEHDAKSRAEKIMRESRVGRRPTAIENADWERHAIQTTMDV